MSDKHHVDLLIIGSGEAGKNLAWAMASAGQRVAGLHTRRPNTCSSRRLPSILRPVEAQGANRVQFNLVQTRSAPFARAVRPRS